MDKQVQKERNSDAGRYEEKYKNYLEKLKKMEARMKAEKSSRAQNRNA